MYNTHHKSPSQHRSFSARSSVSFKSNFRINPSHLFSQVFFFLFPILSHSLVLWYAMRCDAVTCLCQKQKICFNVNRFLSSLRIGLYFQVVNSITSIFVLFSLFPFPFFLFSLHHIHHHSRKMGVSYLVRHQGCPIYDESFPVCRDQSQRMNRSDGTWPWALSMPSLFCLFYFIGS